MNFNFIKATAVFLGTVIGVGIFGLPFIALKAGFLIVICYFLFMVAVASVLHLTYSKIVCGCKEKKRLAGYAEIYLGKAWKRTTFFILSIGFIGTLLAYLVIGGQFLFLFFSPYFGGTQLIYTLIFFITGSYLVLRGIKAIAGVELPLLVVFLIILVFFLVKSFPSINVDHLAVIDVKYLTLPYGVILFSLWGTAVVPEVKEILNNNRNVKKVVISGIVAASIIYLFFIYIVLGVAGAATTKDAISGLAEVLGADIVRLGFLFGAISSFTSFITIALTLEKEFWYDFAIPKKISWAISCFIPLLLFLFGLREFIEIIGLTGALALGAEGLMIIFIYRAYLITKIHEKFNPGYYFLAALLALGVIFQVVYFFADFI